jgi:hypothetical protein
MRTAELTAEEALCLKGNSDRGCLLLIRHGDTYADTAIPSQQSTEADRPVANSVGTTLMEDLGTHWYWNASVAETCISKEVASQHHVPIIA